MGGSIKSCDLNSPGLTQFRWVLAFPHSYIANRIIINIREQEDIPFCAHLFHQCFTGKFFIEEMLHVLFCILSRECFVKGLAAECSDQFSIIGRSEPDCYFWHKLKKIPVKIANSPIEIKKKSSDIQKTSLLSAF